MKILHARVDAGFVDGEGSQTEMAIFIIIIIIYLLQSEWLPILLSRKLMIKGKGSGIGCRLILILILYLFKYHNKHK